DGLAGAFGEDAGELAPADRQIVRPLQRRGKPGRLPDAFHERDTGSERRQQRRALAVARARRCEDRRDVEARTRRRKPRPAPPSAAGRLRVGDKDRAFVIAGGRSRRGDVIRGSDRRKVFDSTAEPAEPNARLAERVRKLLWKRLREVR